VTGKIGGLFLTVEIFFTEVEGKSEFPLFRKTFAEGSGLLNPKSLNIRVSFKLA
jgi:hypothetical protein